MAVCKNPTIVQAKAFCKDKGATVVGYYVANEALHDDKLSAHTARVASRIAKTFHNAIVWQV